MDVKTGNCIAQIGKRTNLDAHTEFYARLVRTKEQMLNEMDLKDTLEEVVLTSQTQYHMIYPLKIRLLKVKEPEYFFFFAILAKNETILVRASSRIKSIATQLVR